MSALSRSDERLLHLIDEGTEQEFMEFKIYKLEMPMDLARHPWFRKGNAHRWIFVRDAYREFLAEQLSETNRQLEGVLRLTAPTSAPVSQPAGAPSATIIPLPTVPLASAPAPSTSASATVSVSTTHPALPGHALTASDGKDAEGTLSTQHKRKRAGNAKSLSAQSKKPRQVVPAASDVIELSSGESDESPEPARTLQSAKGKGAAEGTGRGPQSSHGKTASPKKTPSGSSLEEESEGLTG